jgi:hypothetical protein
MPQPPFANSLGRLIFNNFGTAICIDLNQLMLSRFTVFWLQ